MNCLIAIANSLKLMPAMQGRLDAMALGLKHDDESKPETGGIPNICTVEYKWN